MLIFLKFHHRLVVFFNDISVLSTYCQTEQLVLESFVFSNDNWWQKNILPLTLDRHTLIVRDSLSDLSGLKISIK